jgi:hypothetical protein
LLAIAYRDLAVNAEENHRYREASLFRYLAMDTRRLTEYSFTDLNWLFHKINRRWVWRIVNRPWGRVAFWRLDWWYWLASGYGERIGRAALGLIGVWLLFAVIFTFVGFSRWETKSASETEAQAASYDEQGAPMRIQRSLIYSALVITLQKPEPKPATSIAKTGVILETILGPIQAALLALAIRRRFMR